MERTGRMRVVVATVPAVTGDFRDDRGRSYAFKRDDLVKQKGGRSTAEFRWKQPSAVIVDERTVEIDSQWFKPADDQAGVVAQVRGSVPYGVTEGSTLTWYGEPKDMAVVRDPHQPPRGRRARVHLRPGRHRRRRRGDRV